MTAHELAEKIFFELRGFKSETEMDSQEVVRIAVTLTSALLEEAKLEAQGPASCKLVDAMVYETGLKDGKAAGYEEGLAARDTQIYGESFMLNGKRISPEEVYKSTADYVKEAKKEAYEVAARLVEEKAHTVETTMIGLHLAALIRLRAKELK